MYEKRGLKEKNQSVMSKIAELYIQFTGLKFLYHVIIGYLIRVLFILYGVVQDELFHVPFTDIDYKVFSDAGRYVASGLSPYKRHTYRYSPLIAYLALPNHYIHNTFGKFIFSLLDILTSVVIYRILKIDGIGKSKRTYFTLFWLYNPLSIVISSRGNSDSLSAFLVLLTLYFYRKKGIVLAGLTHGLSVHLRVYPIIYSLPLYLCLKDLSENVTVLNLLYPTVKRIKFVVCFTLSYTSLFIFFYHHYGNQFVNESLLYHFKRVDIRHNYSVFFYFQYLNFELGTTWFHKAGMMSPLLVLLLCFSLCYNTEKDLSFCLLIMSFAFVTYNTVLTCQYFIWYLCLLPLSLPYINCPKKQSIILASMWLLSQLVWLLPAYLLEFQFKNTFKFIWIQGLVFFFSNIMVLSALLESYSTKIKSF